MTAAQKRTRKATPTVNAAESIDSRPFRWSASHIDHKFADKWDWDLQPKETSDLLQLLAGLGDCTWGDVKSMRTNSKNSSRLLHHAQPAASVCKEARDRLDKLGRGDQEELFRLRHGSKVRVWGVIESGQLSIIWYDRDHKVYPTEAS